MPVTRIYLALDPTVVVALSTAREVGPAPLRAHSAPPRRAPFVDEEEAEHLAWLAAADDARHLVTKGSGRRVVASADVESTLVRPNPTAAYPSAVEITAPVPLRAIASFHVDEEPGGEDIDLLWFDVTELGEVARLVAG